MQVQQISQCFPYNTLNVEYVLFLYIKYYKPNQTDLEYIFSVIMITIISICISLPETRIYLCTYN